MSAFTELIYFHIKPTVKPEDPSNEEGSALIQVFETAKQQCGYKNSAWGRTTEDEDLVVWAINWKDAHPSTQSIHTMLTPLLKPSSQITALFTTLQPSTETETLIANPITELCPLFFPSSLTPEERSVINGELIDFRKALVEIMKSEEVRPVSFAVGQVERPGIFPHEKSPSGHAFGHILVVGWNSVEAHAACKKTAEFAGAIAPIRERVIGPLEGLGMRHVHFRKV